MCVDVCILLSLTLWLVNVVLLGPSSARMDAESEKEVWEGVRHESFVKMAGEDSVSIPPVPNATPRTIMSSIHSGAVPERSHSDLRMATRTPISSLKRSQSTPMSLGGSTEAASRGRSRTMSETPIPHRPLLDQLNQIEGETEMIREQTEVSLSHATDAESDGTKLQMQTEDIIEEPREEEVDEKDDGKILETELTEGDGHEEGEGLEVQDVKDDLEVVEGQGEEEPESELKDEEKDEEKQELVEGREASPDEQPREATPVAESPVQSEAEGQGRGTPNECSIHLKTNSHLHSLKMKLHIFTAYFTNVFTVYFTNVLHSV